MSNDAKVSKNIVEVLEDGKKGFDHAADKLAESNRADLAPMFREFSEQRAGFAAELTTMAAAYGDEIDEHGSVKGTIHRGWIAAEQGEDHAVDSYKKALDEDISPELKDVLRRQMGTVQATHDQVKALRNATD